MITYEEALEIARKKFFHSVDECEECEDCYVFSPKLNDNEILTGGGAIVVMKEDGRTYGYTGYIYAHNYTQPKTIRKFDV